MSIFENFVSFYYQRHNQRRLEHLASLDLKLSGKTVLEVGAGIGDHTSFFLDRCCIVTSTDGRKDLLNVLKERYPNISAFEWDVEKPPSSEIPKSNIVYAYGILYHTSDPFTVIKNLAGLTDEMLLLETCVSFGNDESVHLTPERLDDPTQALMGVGCRPTRLWIFNTLKSFFPYVYITRTQPFHEEFPLNWENPAESDNSQTLKRSVFIASNKAIENPKLSLTLIDTQERE